MNDRVYIKCKHCDFKMPLFSYNQIIGGYLELDSEEINELIQDHIECSPNFGKKDLNGDPCFTLITRSKKRDK